MLHCGAAEVARTDLGNPNIVTMPPKTRTYCPVGHEPFVNLVQDKLEEVGFRFGAEAHALTKEGNRYFGLVHLLCGKENEQHALVLGIRNSLDKSFPASLAFGAQVFVCDNLCFNGEIKVARKHTTNIWRDLPSLIGAAVSQTALMRDNMEDRFSCYQERPLSTKQADHLILESLRNGAINTSRVERIVKEWDEPSHDFGPRTVWRLHNAVTEALKDAPLHDVPNRTMQLHAILDRAAGFTPRMPIEGEVAVAA
jgi:hypothetical protein